ncbi:hypothetical protein HDV05_005244 [Chytridiales sp. JEL 0842]|nr:hypothetical protein HDV05_005244 [Chytridiales sp. JEL 0842]
MEDLLAELFGDDEDDHDDGNGAADKAAAAATQDSFEIFSERHPIVKGLIISRNALPIDLQNAILMEINKHNLFNVANGENQAMRFGTLPEYVEPIIHIGSHLLPNHLLKERRLQQDSINDSKQTATSLFDQMIANYYNPGEGIKDHIDLHRFEDGIIIASFLSSIVMEFYPTHSNDQEQEDGYNLSVPDGRHADRVDVLLEPGDVSWLVIGGAGFLGRSIVEQLLSRGERDVTIFDLRQTFTDPRIKEFLTGDLTKPSDVLEATKGKTVVIHTASPHAGLPAKIQFAVNVDGTKNVIDACVKNRVRKLVYTSSASVIFNGQSLVNADESVPYCDVHMDAYNESKALAEKAVLDANGKGGLLTTAIRPSGIFGPRDVQGASSMAETAKKGRTSVQIGNNTTLFDWTYVDNAAYAHILAADKLTDKSGVGGEAFIITNDCPFFFWDFVRQLWFHLGYKRTLKYAMPVQLAFFLAFIVECIAWVLRPVVKIQPTFTVFRIKLLTNNRYFNVEKAKRLLGYKPIVSMEEGIKRTADRAVLAFLTNLELSTAMNANLPEDATNTSPTITSADAPLDPNLQGILRKDMIKTRIENELYIRAHPEIKHILDYFMRQALTTQPANLTDFAAELFSDPYLEEKVNKFKAELILSLMPVTVFSDYRCLLHRGNEGSFESQGEKPERITALLTSIASEHLTSQNPFQKSPAVEMCSNQSRPVGLEDLYRVHSPRYIQKLLDRAPPYSAPGGKRGYVHFSPGHSGVKTSFLSSGSLDAILHAAGTVVDAVKFVVEDPNGSTAFCVIRPPGHHCGWDGVEPLESDMDLAQGFCFVNNVAVAAAHAAARYSLKVAILDFDVHHGNGTEGIIRKLYAQHLNTSPSTPFPILLASTHQYEEPTEEEDAFFPGTGKSLSPTHPFYNISINCPLPPRTGSEGWRDAVASLILPRFKEFGPGLILISAGFDSHVDDENGDLELVEEDYEWIAKELRKVQPKVVSVLEGGYGITPDDSGKEGSMVRSALAHIRGLYK